ncbi:auxin efflux carrier [Melampsora americana]|nr:auxin efflux carrier [Melampsora americana]
MTPDLNLANLIWISFKPVIKNVIPGLVGLHLVRAKRMGIEGVKAAAQIQIYGALPCLMFSNLVPSITSDNSKDVLICLGFGAFYMALSYVLARLLLLFVKVPDHFKNGFIVAAVWSNWGNLPFSVIASLAAEPPFGRVGDQDLGLAYGSFFVLLNNLSLFGGPGIRLIQRDFEDGIDKDDQEVQLTHGAAPDLGGLAIVSAEHSYDRIALPEEPEDSTLSPSSKLGGPSLNTNILDTHPSRESSSSLGTRIRVEPGSQRTISQKLLITLQNLVTPVSVAISLGLITAITPTLKHLFVIPNPPNLDYPKAPDGKPILSILIESASFLGSSAIPLALIITGASFARMSISRETSKSLPFKAIFGLAFMKLVISPIIGLSFVFCLNKYTSLFAGDHKELLKMICIYYSCSVTSTNQISLSALASGSIGQESNVELLCAFILVQVC